jgi:hypothetical protein
VVAIEWIARKGTSRIFQAKVEDENELGMKLEHTLQFSGEDFHSLKGASVALQALRQGNQTDDEDDDGTCTFLGQIPSYIGSWLAQLLPVRRERALDFLCAGVSPPANTTIINMNTQLPKNSVAPGTARMLFLIISTILALFSDLNCSSLAQKADLAQEITYSRKDQQIERLHSVSPPPI